MNSISMLEAMASRLYVLQRLDLYNKDQIAPGVSGDFFSTWKASRHFAANRQPFLACRKPQGVPAWRQKAESMAKKNLRTACWTYTSAPQQNTAENNAGKQRKRGREIR